MTHAPSQSNSPPVLEICTTRISDEDYRIISQALASTYDGILTSSKGRELILPADSYHPHRYQYNADILLTYLFTQKTKEYALWIIPYDLYAHEMNFIFGLASYHQGAVLSLARLHTTDLKVKEAIHETGHILGLRHCRHPCVMQYSNSLQEAQHKPIQLCASCQQLLAKERTPVG